MGVNLCDQGQFGLPTDSRDFCFKGIAGGPVPYLINCRKMEQSLHVWPWQGDKCSEVRHRTGKNWGDVLWIMIGCNHSN